MAPRALGFGQTAKPQRCGRLCLVTVQASQAALAGKNPPEGGERPVGHIGEDSMIAWWRCWLGLDRLERRIGEGRVVAPDGNSSACRAAACLFRSRPAGYQPAVIAWLFMVNAVSGTSTA
jgi:hypothetical protein